MCIVVDVTDERHELRVSVEQTCNQWVLVQCGCDGAVDTRLWGALFGPLLRGIRYKVMYMRVAGRETPFQWFLTIRVENPSDRPAVLEALDALDFWLMRVGRVGAVDAMDLVGKVAFGPECYSAAMETIASFVRRGGEDSPGEMALRWREMGTGSA